MRVVAIHPDGEIKEEDMDIDTLDTYGKFYLFIKAISEPRVVVWIQDLPMADDNSVASLLATDGKLPIDGTAYVGTYEYSDELQEYMYYGISPETVLDLYAIRKHGECKGGCHIL